MCLLAVTERSCGPTDGCSQDMCWSDPPRSHYIHQAQCAPVRRRPPPSRRGIRRRWAPRAESHTLGREPPRFGAHLSVDVSSCYPPMCDECLTEADVHPQGWSLSKSRATPKCWKLIARACTNERCITQSCQGTDMT